MVVGELSKSKVMNIDFPNHECCDCPSRTIEGENRSITVILGENDKLIYYIGLLDAPKVAPKVIKYGKEGIRKELLKRKKDMLLYSSKNIKPDNLSVIIKPSKKSNYGNLVDILNELEMTNINSYAIVPEFTPKESKLLVSN